MALPLYETSEPMVRHDGADWTRTGLCPKCGAAMYGRLNTAARDSFDINRDYPLHHAVSR